MVIGMILDKVFPPDPRVENEALTLVERGHEVHLYCMQFDSSCPERESYKGIQVHRFRFGRIVRKLSALAYTTPIYHFILQKSLRIFISEHKLEALHVHDIQVARAVFWVNRRFKLPVTLDLHENRPAIMEYYSHVNSGIGKWLIWPSAWKRFEYRFIQRADDVIVVTGEARDHYLKHLDVQAEKFHVVPNTVRKEFYSNYTLDDSIASRYEKHFTLLYVGDTGLRRGVMTMIESLEYLIPIIPEIKIVIIGKSTADVQLKELVEANQWQDYVDLEGWQDMSLFPSYILASDIGISPLHRNLHHDTTYANKIFQYLSLGKPIIVSDSTAQAKLVKDYNVGRIFKSRDASDLAEQVVFLYRDRKLYTVQSELASKVIEDDLNWNVLCQPLITLYEK